jgi:hypothetical protein
VRLAPEAFADVIDNPLLPMTPGVTFVYRGVDDDGRSFLDKVEVTDENRVIEGVKTIVVHDRGYVDGKLTESTRDFFAQDKAGNVWDFGEDSKDIENGKVISRSGSWLAGENGAKQGIIMRARPAWATNIRRAGSRRGGRSGRGHRAARIGNRAVRDLRRLREDPRIVAAGARNARRQALCPGIGLVLSRHVDSSGDPTAGEAIRLVDIDFAT